MSPEALKKKPEEINKTSADMWSMGVILWYIQTIIHFLFDYNLN